MNIRLQPIELPQPNPVGTLTYHCKSVTPMFMHRKPGEPDLRTSSFKGMLRFWWRAFHPDLSLTQLKKQEKAIFGGASDTEPESGARSLIRLDLLTLSDKRITISSTPHHTNGYCSPDRKLRPNCQYEIRGRRFNECQKSKPRNAFEYEFILTLSFNPTQLAKAEISKSQLDALVHLSFVMGGFGQRSRRGFGAVWLKGSQPIKWASIPDLYQIWKWIDILSPNLYPSPGQNHFIELDRRIDAPPYPFVEVFRLGKTYKNSCLALQEIGHKSHQYSDGTWRNRNERLASPLYVSCLPCSNSDVSVQIVITDLHTPLKFKKQTNSRKRHDFLTELS